MIDYSVFMMGNPMDVDAAQKAYAKAQVSEIMPFSQFVKHIADHNGVFTRGTVKGVIADMCECLVEMLLEGKKVQLAELGNFWISIGSEGAEDLKIFTESTITAVNIVVEDELRNIRWNINTENVFVLSFFNLIHILPCFASICAFPPVCTC